MRRLLALLRFFLSETVALLGLRYSLSVVFFVLPLFWVLENGIESAQSEGTLVFLGFSCFAFPAAAYWAVQRSMLSNLVWVSLLPVHRMVLLLTLGVARMLALSFGLLHSGVILILTSLFLNGESRTFSWLQVVRRFPQFYWESRQHPWVAESAVVGLSLSVFLMFFLRPNERPGSSEVHASGSSAGMEGLTRRQKVQRWLLGGGVWGLAVLLLGLILWAFQYSRAVLMIVFSFLMVMAGIWNGLKGLAAPRGVRTRWLILAGLLTVLANAASIRVDWMAATHADLVLFSEGQEALGAVAPDLPAERWSDLLQSLQGRASVDVGRLQVALHRLNGGRKLPPQFGAIQFDQFLEKSKGSPTEVAGLLALFEPSLLSGAQALALLKKMSRYTSYPDLPIDLLRVPIESERIVEALRSSEPVLQDFGLATARIRYSGIAAQGLRAEVGRSQVLADIWAIAILNARDERFQKRVQNTLRMILQKDPSEAIQRARTAFEHFRDERHLETPSLFRLPGQEPPPVSMYVDQATGQATQGPKVVAPPSKTPSPLPSPSVSPSPAALPSLAPRLEGPSPVPAPTPLSEAAASKASVLSSTTSAPADSPDAYTPPQKTKTLSQMLDEPNRRVGEKRVRVDTRAVLALPQDDRPPPRRLTRQEYLRASQARADKIAQALEPLHESVISARWLEKPEVAKFVYEFIKTHQLVQLDATRISCQESPFTSGKSVHQDPNASYMDACLWWLAANRALAREQRFLIFAHEDLFPFENHFSYLQAEDQAWVLEVLGFSLPLDSRGGF